ncbi:MAG: 4-diphosphocytidyl-2-C-methyl-D-erythritol kinase [Chlamydiae bacterium]|nr:4-diphosphocytidyl-2-C-methyl-D-erythritol kinase [Chlamydiota bacterium]
MKLLSPAKLNLFFRILGKRSDGYHDISSLHQTIDLFDTITIRPSAGDSFSCTHPDVPKGTDNLILHAVHLFRKTTGKLQPVSIHLEKVIPLESGLGGASSNAATILWGLNELTRRPLSLTQLKLLGRKLGADVPFFFSLGTAHCTGIGELIEDLPALPEQKVFLAVPEFGLSTKEVYQKVDMQALSDRLPEELLSQWRKGEAVCVNDLESAAFSIRPELRSFKEKLQTMPFEQVSMTGSGSAFFCLGFSDVPENLKGQLAKFHSRKQDSWY